MFFCLLALPSNPPMVLLGQTGSLFAVMSTSYSTLSRNRGVLTHDHAAITVGASRGG